MNRTLRGAWSRRGTLLPLLLLTVVVVAGAVTVIGFADEAGTSPLLAVPLLLLGLVAVPATGRELATARRAEIAISRLRGLQGPSLYLLLAAEPLLVLVVGGVLGLVAGAAGSWLAAHLWVDADAALPGASAVLAGAGIVVVALVAVLVGMASALREPLSEQVSLAARPRRAGTGAIFASILVLVGAGVAAYRAGVAGDEPDLVVLAGPALVGLAVGQVVVWLVRLLARLAVGRTSRGGLGGFLAVRRLARVADAAASLRVLVAASVVAALAVTGATQVDDWTDDTARLRAGAPLRIDVDLDAAGVLGMAQAVDPDGRWLMAAVLVAGEGSVAARRAFVDTDRYDRVVGDFFGGTDASGVVDRVGDLADGGSALASGRELSADVEGVSARRSGQMRPRVLVTFRAGLGDEQEVRLRATIAQDGAATTVSVPVSCEAGCVVTDIKLARSTGDTTLPWVLTALRIGDQDVLDAGWKPAFPPRNFRGTPIPGGPEPVDNGLLAVATRRTLEAVPVASTAQVPVLATDTATWDGKPMLDSTGGDERPADVLERLPALPLVEGDGLLADLRVSAAGAPPTVPAAQVMVLARSDTPAKVLAGLDDVAVGAPHTLAQVDRQTADESGAAQARVYSLMAGFCLLVALLVLAAAVNRQRTAWVREVAALRVIGIPLPTLRRSGRVEVGVLVVASVVATVVGAVLAVRLLLAHLALVAVPLHAVPLRSTLEAGPVLLAAVVVALAVAAVSGRGRSVPGERSRPAILREEGAA
ncbi:hypothetical protein H5V45_11855 [Nocardioides sp. KIGAM211]|uniref:ABC3 transporter permease C-terminal domain-containing protein n=1 Tax=Nocardioides luti TaxID=2761101 RepID=A0A7X0RGU8_9ACTN|nr:FtsX-like permease family protein [Nocardioides luti]MBB6628012.1 hypothetical protein [Nocardioides luti]